MKYIQINGGQSRVAQQLKITRYLCLEIPDTEQNKSEAFLVNTYDVQEVYNQDHSLEVYDVEGLASGCSQISGNTQS